MILKNEEDDSILIIEELNLYNITASAKNESVVIINGKQMTVENFRKMRKKNPKAGYWGRKALNEMDKRLI